MNPLTSTAQQRADKVREYQRMTTGTDELHRHFLGLTYTDGMLYVADTCGAHWLLDLVASHQPDIRRKHAASHQPDIRRKHAADSGFQVWRLKKNGTAWRAEAWSDTPDKSTMLVKQDCEYSDFPEELSPFEFFVEGGVALLKEER